MNEGLRGVRHLPPTQILDTAPWRGYLHPRHGANRYLCPIRDRHVGTLAKRLRGERLDEVDIEARSEVLHGAQ